MENARKKVVLATAITKENDVISVWITKAGEITDSVFLLEMAEEITKYFTEKVNYILPESKVKAYSELRDIPSAQLNSSENIETYLQQQPVFSYVRIFVDSDNYNQENTMNMLEQVFDGQDATWYVYLCDNPDAIDLSFYDLSKFDYSGSVEKDN